MMSDAAPGKPSRDPSNMINDDLRKRVIDPAGRRTSVEHRRPSLSILSLGDLSIRTKSEDSLSMYESPLQKRSRQKPTLVYPARQLFTWEKSVAFSSVSGPLGRHCLLDRTSTETCLYNRICLAQIENHHHFVQILKYTQAYECSRQLEQVFKNNYFILEKFI